MGKEKILIRIAPAYIAVIKENSILQEFTKPKIPLKLRVFEVKKKGSNRRKRDSPRAQDHKSYLLTSLATG